MPDKADLVIYQGDDFSAVCTVLNSDGSPADITGFTAQGQIRSDVADAAPTVIAEMQTTVASPDVQIFLAHDVTTTLKCRKYVWDLQVTSPTGEITTVLYGKVSVTLEVTRE